MVLQPYFITSGIFNLKSTGVLPVVRENTNIMVGSSSRHEAVWSVAMWTAKQNRCQWEEIPSSGTPRIIFRSFWSNWQLHYADSGRANKIWIITIHWNYLLKEGNIMTLLRLRTTESKCWVQSPMYCTSYVTMRKPLNHSESHYSLMQNGVVLVKWDNMQNALETVKLLNEHHYNKYKLWSLWPHHYYHYHRHRHHRHWHCHHQHHYPHDHQ